MRKDSWRMKRKLEEGQKDEENVEEEQDGE